jgi:hypothetical protein
MELKIPETPDNASINRVMIVDLPGLPIDEEVRGQKAYHMLSSLAVVGYAKDYRDALKLPEAYTEDSEQVRRQVPLFIEECLQNGDAEARRAAQAIGRRLGRNLGHILLTLHRGDAVNQAARPDWTAVEWACWQSIRQVYLGGGMMRGHLGNLVTRHARAFLAEVGYAGRPEIRRTPHPHNMAIVGAGRYLPPTTHQALCLDFGHTLVKRARLSFEQGTLKTIHTATPLPAPWDWRNDPSAAKEAGGPHYVLDFVSRVVTQTFLENRQEGFAPDPDVMLCIAAYVRGGRLLGNGIYATMSTLAADVRPLLSKAVAVHIGWAPNIHLIHDGTAAAAVHAGEPHSAILVIGTAIGVGFPPATERHLRPVAFLSPHSPDHPSNG